MMQHIFTPKTTILKLLGHDCRSDFCKGIIYCIYFFRRCLRCQGFTSLKKKEEKKEGIRRKVAECHLHSMCLMRTLGARLRRAAMLSALRCGGSLHGNAASQNEKREMTLRAPHPPSNKQPAAFTAQHHAAHPDPSADCD